MKKFLYVIAALAIAGCSATKEVVEVHQGPAGINGTNGQDGSNGTNGANGHSLVSVYQPATQCECGEQGGSRLDIYLDVDDNLSLSEGDLYQNSLIVCNGANGLNGINGQDGAPGLPGVQGPQGEQGPQGIAGEQGPQGLQGLIGPQGLVGATGPQGDTGAVGPQGQPGIAGPTGPQGPQGPAGAQGPVGPAGASGSGATITVYANNSSCVSIVGSTYYLKSGDIYDVNTCSSSHKVAVLQGSGSSFWVASKMLATDNDGSGLRVITFN